MDVEDRLSTFGAVRYRETVTRRNRPATLAITDEHVLLVPTAANLFTTTQQRRLDRVRVQERLMVTERRVEFANGDIVVAFTDAQAAANFDRALDDAREALRTRPTAAVPAPAPVRPATESAQLLVLAMSVVLWSFAAVFAVFGIVEGGRALAAQGEHHVAAGLAILLGGLATAALLGGVAAIGRLLVLHQQAAAADSP